MPTCDYPCPAIGEVVEISLRMAERACDTGPRGAPVCGGGACGFDA